MLRSTALASLLILAAEPQDKAPAEDTHTCQKGSLIPTLELEASFEALEITEFKLRMEAYQGEMALMQVLPQGAEVQKGAVVFALDPRPVEKQVAAAENDLRVARAALAKAQADVKQGAEADVLALAQAETSLKNAETALKVFLEVEGVHLVRQADLLVTQGEDGIKDQLEELEQLKKMYKSEELTNATSEIVVRRAERALERNRTFLEMTRKETQVVRTVRHPRELKGHEFTLETAKGSLAALKTAQALSKVEREAALVRATAAATDQEEKLGKLRKDLDAFTFRAPFGGRVYYGEQQNGQWATAEAMGRLLVPGEKLLPGPALLTLCGPRTRARAELPETAYFDVATDQAATVSPTALPDRALEGRVRTKAAMALPKGLGAAFDLRIEFAEPPADLFHGMKGKAVIRGAEIKDAILVPAAAVSSSGTKHSVTVSKDGKTSSREVTVGKTDGKMVQVKSGLEAGEKVVVSK